MVNLVTVPDVELMRTGKWNLSTGDWECTPHEISAAIEAHDKGLLRKPVIRLGHNDPRFSGDPAVGWLDNLRSSEDGNALIGDMVGVPEWLAEILPSAYPSRSIEGLYDYTAPDGSSHDFLLTGMALLGVTAPGVENLQSLQDVARLYDIAAAGQVGGKAIEFTIQAAAPAAVEKGAAVPTFMEKMAEKLGLAADADESAILEAISKSAVEPVAEPVVEAAPVVEPVAEPVTEPVAEPIAASSGAVSGIRQIDEASYSALVAAAEAGQRAEKRQLAEDREGVVMAAIKDGRIPFARKSAWLTSLEADPVGMGTVLAGLAKGLVPVTELGHGLTGEPGQVDTAMESIHDRIMAGAGFVSKKAGSR